MPLPFRRPFAGLLAVLATAGVASAQPNHDWLQPASGTTANWSTAIWRVGPPTGAGSATTSITLNTLGNNTNAFTFSNNVGAYTVNGFTFNTFGAAFVQDLGANNLTLGGTNPFINHNGSATATISGAGNVALGAATTFGGAGNGELVVASVVNGANALTVNRSSPFGSLALTGTNLFSGLVTIQNGVLRVVGDTGLGATTNGVTFASGGNGALLSGATTFDAGRTLTMNAPGTIATIGAVTWAGPVTGTGALTKVGTGTALTMSGNLSGYTGAIQLGGTTRVLGQSTFARPYLPANSPEGLTLVSNGTAGTGVLPAGVPSITAGLGAGLIVDNSVLAETGRVKASTALNLNGGRLVYRPGASGPGTLNESFGALTLNGHGTLSTNLQTGATAGPAGGSIITFASLTRNDRASLTLYGRPDDASQDGKLGGTPGAARTNFLVTGGVAVPPGSGTAIGVVPWAHFATHAFGAGYASGLVTYDANGFRPLAAGEFTTPTDTAGLVAAAGTNARLDGDAFTVAGALSLKSLFVDHNSGNFPTFTGAGTLTVENGAISLFNAVTFSGPTLNFGAQTGYISMGDFFTLNGTSSITGSQGVVFTSASTDLNFNKAVLGNTTGNPFTGGIYITGNAVVGYTNENQLGATTEPVVLGGGILQYDGTAATTLSTGRDLRVNEASGALRAGTANIVTVNSRLTGAGQLTVDTAAGGANSTVVFGNGTSTNSGGLVLGGTNAQTIAYAANASGGGSGAFGAGPVLVNNTSVAGAVIRVDVASAVIANPITFGTSTTINTQTNATTLGGSLDGRGNVTKTGTGLLSLTGASPNLSGAVVVGAGGLTLSGANGAIPQVPNLTVTTNATFTLDNTAAYNGNRFGDTSAITFTGPGAVASYVPPTSGASNPAERLGVLSAAASGGVFSVTGSGSQPIVLSFQSLNAANSITLRGADLGGTAGNFTRIMFEGMANQNVLTNVFYANTAGTASSSTPAGYDTVRGVIPFTPPPESGNTINNVNSPNTSIVAAYTTTGDTTAVTGAQIFSLTMTGGSSLTLTGGNAAQGSNNNTPDGTLAVIGGQLIANAPAKTITSAAARTLAFGSAAGNISLNTDLTIAQNVTIQGTSGLTVDGSAGTLLVNGPLNVGGTVAAAGGRTITLASTATLGTSRLSTTNGVINFNPVGATVAGVDVGGTGAVNLNGAGTVTGFTFSGGQVNVNANTVIGSAGATGSSGQFNIAAGSTLSTTTGGLTINVPMSGSGAFTFAPATIGNSITLGGASNHSGGTTVTDGSVILTNPSGFGTGNVNWTLTATRQMTVPAGTVPNAFTFNNSGTTFDITHATGTSNLTTDFTGVISGTIAAGSGVLQIGVSTNAGANNVVRLSNAGNTFTGNVQVFEGFVAVTSNGSLGNAANTLTLFTTNPGGLRLDGPNIDINRPVALTFSTQTVNTNGNNATISGVLSGGSNLLKSGAGILTLSNPANTLTGAVTVGGGTLRINGLVPGAGTPPTVTVNAAATLGGTGTIGTDGSNQRHTTLAAGSILAPGASIGNLTTFGNVTMNGAPNPNPTTWQVEVNGIGPNTAATADTVNTDRLLVNGNITFATTTTNRIRIDVSHLAGTFSNPNQPVFFSVATYSGTLTGFDASHFDVVGAVVQSGTGSVINDTTGQQILLSFTPVPEPATVLAVGAAGLAAVGAIRRRRVVA